MKMRAQTPKKLLLKKCLGREAPIKTLLEVYEYFLEQHI